MLVAYVYRAPNGDTLPALVLPDSIASDTCTLVVMRPFPAVTQQVKMVATVDDLTPHSCTKARDED